MVKDEIDWTRLLIAAEQSVQSAYAPYSEFRVGAAVLTNDGQLFVGSNVENASYGLTICAERAAIFAAVGGTPGKKPEIVAVAIVTDPPLPGSPCGACRQVIAEFGPDAAISYLSSGGRVQWPLSTLLFDPFRIS